MSSALKSEPDEFDLHRGFDVLIPNDEIKRGIRGRFRGSGLGQRRARLRCLAWLVSRRPFVL